LFYIDIDGLCIYGDDNDAAAIFFGEENSFESPSFHIRSGTIVGLELNTNKQTLHFFIDSEQFPCLITDVPHGMCFVVCFYFFSIFFIIIYLYLFVYLFL
jgi:hypothetical protein